jgi:phosphatidylglycerophosphatase C
MNTLACHQVQAALVAQAPGIVAFDGDGTLWTGDIAEDVVHAVLERRLVKPEAYPEFVAELQPLMGKVPTDVHDAARLVLEMDRHKQLDHVRTCELLGSLFAGYTQADLHALATAILEERKLKERLIEESWQVRADAEAAGHMIMVVSASPLPIVIAACDLVGFNHPRAGVTVRVTGGKYCTEVVRPIPYAEGKVHAIRQHTNLPIVAALGDNRFDMAMLQASKLPLAVRPKQALLDIAGELPALALLRR